MKKAVLITLMALFVLALGGCCLRHEPTIDAAVAPTCTESGLTEGIHCAKCGEVLAEQLPVAATGHTETVSRRGTVKVCSRVCATDEISCATCGVILQEQEIIPASQHEYDSGKCIKCGIAWVDYTSVSLYASDDCYEYLGSLPGGSAMMRLYDSIDRAMVSFHKNNSRTLLPDSKGRYPIERFNFSELGLTQEQAVKVLVLYRRDHPLYYWLSSRWSCTSTSITVYSDADFANGADRLKYTKLIYEGIERYAVLAEGESSAYNIALIYYEAIRADASYAYGSDGNPETALWAHSILGIFTEGRFVCEGYAKLFQLMLSFSGVEEIYVTGDSHNERHAWNMVQLDDGRWYWFDLTWDDRDNTYKYFCNTESNFIKDHVPETPQGEGVRFNVPLPERSKSRFQSDEFAILYKSFTFDGVSYIRNTANTVKLMRGATDAEYIVFDGRVYSVIK